MHGQTAPLSQLQRPMPVGPDRERVEMQVTRYRILSEEHDQIVEAWLEDMIGEQRAARWGKPDTSFNSLGSIARQLTTPGLYGVRPTVFWAGSDESSALTRAGGYLDQAGYWTRMQHVQYMTVGMGDFFLHFGVVDGKLVLTNVPPQDIELVAESEHPTQPTMLKHLRARFIGGQWRYAHDVYDLGCTALGIRPARAPSLRVVLCETGADVTVEVLGRKFEGAEYPYRDLGGRPLFPYVQYKDTDQGALWNSLAKRGAARGALNSMLYFTYAGRCARDAAGKMIIASGLMPITGNVARAGGADAVRSLEVESGAILYHEPIEGAQPFVQEVGPAGNLPEVADFARNYFIQQMVNWGLNPSDLQRTASAPSSGISLFLSNKQKREAAAAYAPIFRRCDLEAFRVASAVLRTADITVPDDGYSLDYAEIPESPEEERERRERIQWQVDQGFLSPVEAYRELHEGVSRDDALEALVEAAVDKQLIAARIAERTSALTAQPPAQSPTP